MSCSLFTSLRWSPGGATSVHAPLLRTINPEIVCFQHFVVEASYVQTSCEKTLCSIFRMHCWPPKIGYSAHHVRHQSRCSDCSAMLSIDVLLRIYACKRWHWHMSNLAQPSISKVVGIMQQWVFVGKLPDYRTLKWLPLQRDIPNIPRWRSQVFPNGCPKSPKWTPQSSHNLVGLGGGTCWGMSNPASQPAWGKRFGLNIPLKSPKLAFCGFVVGFEGSHC